MTTRVALGFMVIALLLGARPAAACPASANPCLKYKARVVQLEPLYYVRDAKSALPRFSEQNVSRFLIRSLWTPVFPDAKTVPRAPTPYGQRVMIDQRKVRFVDPDHVPPPRTNTRDAFAGQIMQTDGFMFVDVYGQTFLLTRCTNEKGHACLEPFKRPAP
jgi:hypothetical protein